MTSSCWETLLSTDLKEHIFDFLPLQSCLRYSQVSHRSIREILPHLKRRRFRQFCERQAYQLVDPNKLRPAKTLSNYRRSSRNDDSKESLCQPITGDKEQWHIVPSVQERMESLYQALPAQHSSNEDVRRLWLDLQADPLILLSEEGIQNAHFPSTLQELHTLTLAHRRHEELVRECTVDANPPPATSGFTDNPDIVLTTTLEQYIGDVLVACFLMSHLFAGMVEGCTTFSQWTKLVSTPDTQPVAIYKCAVFLHSNILRIYPMTKKQLRSYKLPMVGIQGKTRTRAIEYIQPHYCFLNAKGFDLFDKATQQAAEKVQNLLRTYYSLDMRWNSFGPLGPAFRGRDRVQSVHRPIMDLAVCLQVIELRKRFSMNTPLMYSDDGQHTLADDEGHTNTWFTAEMEPNDLASFPSWFFHLPRICFKSRPMTVEHPVVSIIDHGVPMGHPYELPI